MRLDDRARRSADELRRVVGALDAVDPTARVERFYRNRARTLLRQRVAAGLMAAVIGVAAMLLVVQALGPTREETKASPHLPNGSILYGRWDADRQHSSWFTVRPDGTGTRDLGVVATCAQWWPDGSKILITNDAAFGPGSPLRPATIDPDGTHLKALDATKDDALNLGCGDVSPDGRRLVLEGFNERRREVNGLYTVSATDGGDLARLTHSLPGSSDAYPQYSPDGTQVGFFRTKEGVSPQGSGALFVVNIDGSGVRRITPWGSAFLTQSWSPDGSWIAFQRPYGELTLVHPDGTGLHQLPVELPPGSGIANPSWSPDGTMIVLSLERDGHANIFLVRPDGTGLLQVTHDVAVDAQTPDWGPPVGNTT
jgi:dipeptidyl aminopeptidase/acylaminoacyl peptidase